MVSHVLAQCVRGRSYYDDEDEGGDADSDNDGQDSDAASGKSAPRILGKVARSLFVSLLSKTLRRQPHIDHDLALGYMLSCDPPESAFEVFRSELPKLSHMVNHHQKGSKKGGSAASSMAQTASVFLDDASFTRFQGLFRVGENAGIVWEQPAFSAQCRTLTSNMRWWATLTRLGVQFNPQRFNDEGYAMELLPTLVRTCLAHDHAVLALKRRGGSTGQKKNSKKKKKKKQRRRKQNPKEYDRSDGVREDEDDEDDDDSDNEGEYGEFSMRRVLSAGSDDGAYTAGGQTSSGSSGLSRLQHSKHATFETVALVFAKEFGIDERDAIALHIEELLLLRMEQEAETGGAASGTDTDAATLKKKNKSRRLNTHASAGSNNTTTFTTDKNSSSGGGGGGGGDGSGSMRAGMLSPELFPTLTAPMIDACRLSIGNVEPEQAVLAILRAVNRLPGRAHARLCQCHELLLEQLAKWRDEDYDLQIEVGGGERQGKDHKDRHTGTLGITWDDGEVSFTVRAVNSEAAGDEDSTDDDEVDGGGDGDQLQQAFDAADVHAEVRKNLSVLVCLTRLRAKTSNGADTSEAGVAASPVSPSQTHTPASANKANTAAVRDSGSLSAMDFHALVDSRVTLLSWCVQSPRVRQARHRRRKRVARQEQREAASAAAASASPVSTALWFTSTPLPSAADDAFTTSTSTSTSSVSSSVMSHRSRDPVDVCVAWREVRRYLTEHPPQVRRGGQR